MGGGSAVKIYLLSPLPAFWCEAMLNQTYLILPPEKPLPPLSPLPRLVKPIFLCQNSRQFTPLFFALTGGGAIAKTAALRVK